MASNNMTPLVFEYDPEVNRLIDLAKEITLLGDWGRLQAVMNDANDLLRPVFPKLVRACSFSNVHDSVWQTMRQLSLLDLVNPKPFKPRLVHPNKVLSNTVDAQAYIDDDPMCQLGSTVHFLSYLFHNRSAGLSHPIAHLQSQGCSNSGYPACLYVTNPRNEERELRLANLYNFDRGKSWRYFAISKQM